MEGTLSKWTNMVHGWQHRYFVLNDDMLCYYTSKEKMARGQQRGCIRLRGAALGIDEENQALFTIAVDGKVFHLQGKTLAERDCWVRALERVIHEKCGYYKPPQEDPVVDLAKRVATAENQSQMLTEQIRNMEQIKESEKADHKRKKLLNEILMTAKRLQGSVDNSLILLRQVQHHFGKHEAKEGHPGPSNGKEGALVGEKRAATEVVEANGSAKDEEEEEEEEAKDDLTTMDADQIVSYSSSDDEFFDAEAVDRRGSGGGSKKERSLDGSTKGSSVGSRRASKEGQRHGRLAHHGHGHHLARLDSREEGGEEEPDWGDAHENFDAIYNNTAEQDVGDINKQHGSVLMHLLSQVSIGMDLSKVTLPTFILERRSLLEMYAEFFAHPDDFVSSVDLTTPEARFLAVMKFYLNSFYPARKSGVAKKPYNPILGETFRCRWTLPGSGPSENRTQRGPFPGSSTNQVTFVAEQVSHHPPISAFYAEHPESGVSFNSSIYTKSSFLGLSIGVHFIGSGTVTLHKYGEEYTITYPSGYGRSIMSTPWVELGGKVEIRCDQTHYRAEIEFLTKPIFRGKAHQIQGNIFHGHGSKKPIMHLKGEWNSQIYIRRGEGGEYQLFTNVTEKPEVSKECTPVLQQEERESRRMWRHVTVALFRENIETATQAKRWLEQRQRDEKARRDKEGVQWKARFFEKHGDGWRYKESLKARNGNF